MEKLDDYQVDFETEKAYEEWIESRNITRDEDARVTPTTSDKEKRINNKETRSNIWELFIYGKANAIEATSILLLMDPEGKEHVETSLFKGSITSNEARCEAILNEIRKAKLEGANEIFEYASKKVLIEIAKEHLGLAGPS